MSDPHFSGHLVYGHESTNNLTDHAAMRNKLHVVATRPATIRSPRGGCQGCSVEQQAKCQRGPLACEGEIDARADSGEVVRM